MVRLSVSGPALEVQGDSLLMDDKPVACTRRKLSEMREVLLDSSVADGPDSSRDVYLMFRSVIPSDAAQLFKEHSIRFDITIIHDMNLGAECNKTFGHYHPEAEQGLGFPEVYAVIDGSATFIMQKRLEDSDFDVQVVQAKAGDVVLMPPNYGHVTVNSGKGRLILANLVSSAFKSDYESIARMHGAAVYILANGVQAINGRYKKFCITHLDSPPRVQALIGLNSANIYDKFVENPGRFAFLNRPNLLV